MVDASDRVVCVRYSCYYLPDGQGCRHVLELGSRAGARRAQEGGSEGRHPLLRFDCYQHLREAPQVVAYQDAEDS